MIFHVLTMSLPHAGKCCMHPQAAGRSEWRGSSSHSPDARRGARHGWGNLGSITVDASSWAAVCDVGMCRMRGCGGILNLGRGQITWFSLIPVIVFNKIVSFVQAAHYSLANLQCCQMCSSKPSASQRHHGNTCPTQAAYTVTTTTTTQIPVITTIKDITSIPQQFVGEGNI